MNPTTEMPRLSLNILYLDLVLLNKFLEKRAPDFGFVTPLILSPPEALQNALRGIEEAVQKSVVEFGALRQFLQLPYTARTDVFVWFWADLGTKFYSDRLPSTIPLARQFVELVAAYYVPFISGSPVMVYEALRQGVRKVYEAQALAIGEGQFGEPYSYAMPPPKKLLQTLAAVVNEKGVPRPFSLRLTPQGTGPLMGAVMRGEDYIDAQVAWWSYGALGVSQDEAEQALLYAVEAERVRIVDWIAERVPGSLVVPLAAAARKDTVSGADLVRTLLDAGADESAWGGYAIGVAAKTGAVENLQILLDECIAEAQENEEAGQMGEPSALQKRLRALELPLRGDTELDLFQETQASDGEFCFDPREEPDNALVQNEFAPSYPENMTLLAVAAYYGHLRAVQLLVGKGANVRARNNLALRVAFDRGNWRVFVWLLTASGTYTQQEIDIIREPLAMPLPVVE